MKQVQVVLDTGYVQCNLHEYVPGQHRTKSSQQTAKADGTFVFIERQILLGFNTKYAAFWLVKRPTYQRGCSNIFFVFGIYMQMGGKQTGTARERNFIKVSNASGAWHTADSDAALVATYTKFRKHNKVFTCCPNFKPWFVTDLYI